MNGGGRRRRFGSIGVVAGISDGDKKLSISAADDSRGGFIVDHNWRRKNHQRRRFKFRKTGQLSPFASLLLQQLRCRLRSKHQFLNYFILFLFPVGGFYFSLFN
jgi:hypothetical protein